MEDSSTTDATLALYRELRATGHENVGVVLQACLRRTLDDVPGLDNVRLCKGIYVEPPNDRLPGSRRGARELRPLPRGAARAGHLRRDRDPRRAPDRGGAPPRRASAGLDAEPLRVPDAARRRAGARRRARRAPATACGSTSRSGRTGTSTRCGGSRRTRRSPATSRPTSPAASCGASAAGSRARVRARSRNPDREQDPAYCVDVDRALPGRMDGRPKQAGGGDDQAGADAHRPRTRSEKPPSTTSVWPRIIVGVGRAEERDRGGDVVRRDEPADRVRRADAQHLLAVREVLERAGLDDAGRDGVDADPAARARRRGSARATRARPSTCRSGRSCRARAGRRATRSRRSTSRPASAARRRGRAQQRARVRVHRPVPVLVLGLERRADDARSRRCGRARRAARARRPRSSTRSEVTLPRTSTGSAPSARSSSAVASAALSLRR